MSVDTQAIRDAATRAANYIEQQCYEEGGNSDFDRSRAANIIAREMEPVVRDAMKKAERRARKE